MNKLIVFALLSVVFHGCSQHMSMDYGVSTKQNLLAQEVDPDAVKNGSTADGMDGIKAGIALEEYKTADNKNRGERLIRDVGD